MLASALLLLQAATIDPSASARDAASLAGALGISIAEAEARMRIVDRLGIFQLRARSDPDFAGAYLSHEPKVEAVVLFKGDAAAKLARYGTAGDGFSARSVAHSLADLETARTDAAKSFEAAGLRPIDVAVDIEANHVVALFIDPAPASRLRLPDAVVLETAEGELPPAPQSAGPVTHFPQARQPSRGGGDALVHGRLFVRDGCLRIGEEAGFSHLPLWPSSARLAEAGGTPTVTIGDRTLTAGSTVALAGGGNAAKPPPGWLLEPVTERCAGPYWIVSDSW